MIQNVTNIVIASAAVIGLVPLGIRSLRDLIRTRSRKRNNDWLGTIGLSVLLSLVAPSALESLGRHLRAAGDALPDWVKAAIPEQPPPSSINGQSSPPPDPGPQAPQA